MKRIVFAAMVMLLAISSQTVFGQNNKVTLRFGDYLPLTHFATEHITLPWIHEIENSSDAKISIKHYPAGQAGKGPDLLKLLQSGVLDMAQITPDYTPGKTPLSSVVGLPGLFNSSCEATRAFMKLAEDNGFLYKNEYKKNGIRPLIYTVLPPYRLDVNKSSDIKNLEELRGLKLRAAGSTQELTLSELGITAVQMAAPQIYESITRGTIDGMLFPFTSVASYQLQPYVKTSIASYGFGSVVSFYAISEKKWEALSDGQRKLLKETGLRASLDGCKAYDEYEAKIKKEVEGKGAKFVVLSDADMAKLAKVSAEVTKEWAGRLDKRDIPGTKAVEAFEGALKN